MSRRWQQFLDNHSFVRKLESEMVVSFDSIISCKDLFGSFFSLFTLIEEDPSCWALCMLVQTTINCCWLLMDVLWMLLGFKWFFDFPIWVLQVEFVPRMCHVEALSRRHCHGCARKETPPRKHCHRWEERIEENECELHYL